MRLSQCAVLALIPYLGAAFIPWLNTDSVTRALLITVVWAALLSSLIAGVVLGGTYVYQNRSASVSTSLPPQSKVSRSWRITRLYAQGVFILLVLALLSYLLLSPLVALALVSLAQYGAITQLLASPVVEAVAPEQKHFLNRVMWASIGCLLMLALSFIYWLKATA